MKTNVLPITAGVFGSLALAVAVSGQFIDVTYEQVDMGAPECFRTFRVMAHFHGMDTMLAWGAIPGEGELDFFTYTGVNLLNGDGALDGLKFGDFAGFSNVEYDSWVTVGATDLAGNATDYSPGFIGSNGIDAAIVGNSFDETDGLVFNSNPKNPWFGPDVVMAQFTLPVGNLFHLGGVVKWRPAGGGGVNVDEFVVGVLPPVCLWDLDGDYSVGALELLSLLASWGPSENCGPPDFDGDGSVGASDLLLLLANWGPCP
ncbi:MAG: hypothetical protein V3T53_08455 [Phycisphaerales bacterium]